MRAAVALAVLGLLVVGCGSRPSEREAIARTCEHLDPDALVSGSRDDFTTLSTAGRQVSDDSPLFAAFLANAAEAVRYGRPAEFAAMVDDLRTWCEDPPVS